MYSLFHVPVIGKMSKFRKRVSKVWSAYWCSKYPVRRCVGTQNPLPNYSQKGLEHKGILILAFCQPVSNASLRWELQSSSQFWGPGSVGQGEGSVRCGEPIQPHIRKFTWKLIYGTWKTDSNFMEWKTIIFRFHGSFGGCNVSDISWGIR